MGTYKHLNTVEEEAFAVEDKEAASLEAEIARRVSPQTSSVQEELRRERIVQYESTREQTRILFITNDTHFFDTSYSRRQQLIELAEVFDEIHVLVLGSVAEAPTERVRIETNAWIYGTGSHGFLFRLYDGYQRAVSELVFHDQFRADIIVALEPYEAAALAAYLSRSYGRPWQLHVAAALYAPEALGTHPWWRTRLARYALKRVESVRTETQAEADAFQHSYPKVTDVAVLPHYHQVHALLDRPELKDANLYAQFAFTMVVFGAMTADSTLYRALDAAAPLLKTPSIGLVVIGDGPMKRHLRERAQLLGIEKQVMFHNTVPDRLRYLASADALIVTETHEESDEMVLQAAALGVPMVVAHTDLRDDLFVDGTHAFLCESEDVIGYTKKLRQLLNNSQYRKLFARTAPQVIRDRIEEDPRLYRFAYRQSIESVLWSGQTEVENEPGADEEEGSAAAPSKAGDTMMIGGVEMKVPHAEPEQRA